MERRGSLLNLLLTSFCVAFLCSTAFAQTGGANDPEWAPTITLPDDSLVVWCVADSICFDISGSDPDTEDTIMMSLVSGPISYETQWFGYEFTTTVCFLPEGDGEYEFIWYFRDKQAHEIYDTVVYTVQAGSPPVLDDQQFSADLCDLKTDRVLPLDYTGAGSDLLFELLSGPGSIDPQTGVISYQPDTSGTFLFEVGLTSVCGGDTAIITDVLVLNLPPYCIGFDSVLYLCDPGEICFEVLAFDPEDDPIEITMLEGLGTFTQTTDSSGTTCFTPAALDSAEYSFIFRAADSCVLSSGEALSEPYCCIDTVNIIVVITDPGELACPPDTTIELCVPPLELPVEICLPGFTSTWETTTVSLGSLREDTLCFMADTLGTYEIDFVGSDTCGHVDTCRTLVTIEGNNTPYVTMADDYSVDLCVPETICFAATADDLDFDIADIVVNYGYFDQSTGRICFDADSSGVYQIIMTATDECGVSDTDTTNVAVTLYNPPTVALGPDQQISLCNPEEICLDAVVTGERINFFSTSDGAYYNAQTGQLCFTPDSSGTYEIFLQVEDACNNVVADTVLVEVTLSSEPVITGLPDSSLYLCYPTEICLPVDISDPDNDIVSITTNLGQYRDGQICFVPYSMGNFEIVLTVVDECGHEVVDTAVVEVTTDQSIDLVCPGDTTIFLCEPDTLCFPIEGIPEGATVTVDGIATYWDAETESICFYSDCCLENELTVSVTTPCGTYSCSFNVSVQTNSRPLVFLPTDTTLSLCEPQTVCLPLAISDVDGNVADITVVGADWDAYESTVCFEALEEGPRLITVEVTDSCGAVVVDEMNVTVEFNDSPWITSQLEDSIFRFCELTEICLPVDYGDPNGDFVTIYSPQTNLYMIDMDTKLTTGVCFTPAAYGDTCITIIATDSCGLADTVDVCVTVIQPEPVVIDCPAPIEQYQCGPGEFCMDIPISGDVLSVTTNIGTWTDGRWCVNVDQPITEVLTIIAEGECGSDTCEVPLTIIPVESPYLTCPDNVDTLLCGPDTLSFEIALLEGAGPNERVMVNPPAWVEVTDRTAVVYVPVLEPGVQTIAVTYASEPCEPASCEFIVKAAFNTAPDLSVQGDTFETCELAEICLPFEYGDIDGNLVDIVSSEGVVTLLDEFSGQVCFTPTSFGEHVITLSATDECGEQTEVSFTVVVTELPVVAIDCPVLEMPLTFCDPGPQCIDLSILGEPLSVSTSMGTWENGQLCFDFEGMQPGYYEITVTAEGACNTDQCVIPLLYLTPVEVTCQVPDTTLMLCSETTTLVQMPVNIAGDEYTVRVVPDIYTYADGLVDVNVTTPGSYPVTVIASNACSTDSCEFVVKVDVNTAPEIAFGDDLTVAQCDFEEICLPYTLADLEGDVVEIRSSLGVIIDGEVCFTPTEFGSYELVITATDACGASNQDTIQVTVEMGQYVSMTCPPELIPLAIDLPDTVRIPIGIEPLEVDVTVAPNGYYDYTTGEVVLFIESEGLHEFTVTAAAQCNTEICQFYIEVGEYIPPFVDCIGSVDTLLCLSRPRNVCLPVSVFGTDVQVEVSAPATFTGDAVCIDIDSEGEYIIDIMAYTDRDTARCQTVMTVTGGNPPLLDMPAELDYTLCEPGEICFDVVLEDADFDITNINLNYGSYDIGSGRLCFLADTAGTYVIDMSVADSCGNSAEGTTTVLVDLNQTPSVSLGDDVQIFGCAFSEVCLDVFVADDDLVTITTNLGTYNETTGQICFLPEVAGSYEVIVTATDQCGAMAQDTALVEISENQPPVMAALRDTSVYLCFPTEICIDVDVADPDGNLASVETSFGTYADGKVCFVPYSKGDYEIIVVATDECGAIVKDTAVVTITTDQDIELVCPGDTTIFLCEPDTLCFPIQGIPEGAEVTVDGLATYWNAETQSVCFYSDCCLENEVTVYVTTECGTYSCSFNVSVQTNSRPLVLLPRDTTVLQCALEPICLPVGISDIDGNIASVEVTGGSYDDYANTICITPDMAGNYLATVTVTDSCGAVGTDEIVIDVVLNEAPIITYTPDNFIYKQCEPEEICVPIGLDDINDNITDITVVGGRYDADNGMICILPDGIGTFCAQVTVTDDCELTATQEVCVTVAAGDYVEIACNETPDPGADLCEPQEVCFSLPVTGDNYTVTTDFGTWENDALCFFADTSGTYVITVIAESQCVVDTCVMTVPITILEPLAISCPENDSVFVCGPEVLVYDFTYLPVMADVVVSPPAYLENGQIHVPVDQAGTQTITVTASNHCGEVACSFDVKAVFNTAPTVSLGDDLNFTECDLHEICIPFETIDSDLNGFEYSIVVTPFEPGMGVALKDGAVCFTPFEYGEYEVIFTVWDDCAAEDVDTVMVTYTEGKYASIQCPDGTQYASICGADSVCILAPIFDAESITILPSGTYHPETGEVCVYVTEGGTRQVTIIAESQCGSDTCSFNLEVDMGEAPVVECPGAIDTLLCLVEPDTLRIPITVTGTGLQVNVNPTGYYSAGVVNLPINTAGEYLFEIIAFGTCGVDSCDIAVNVTADQAPVLTLPDTLTFERCPDDTDPICLDGIFATDLESDVVITQVCGPGTFSGPSPDSGAVCFVPTAFGTVELCFEADDGCHVVSGSTFVNIVTKDDCDVCVRLSIDGGEPTPVGLRKRVAINVETNDPIGGFDILLGFDASALTFLFGTMDEGDAESWEYFTWNLSSDGCGTACPSGVVRFVGIADQNNGAAHPPDSAFVPNGALFYIEFQVANDQNLGDVFVPISFVWYDCADNAVSDTTGTLLYVDSRIYNAEHVLLWDEFDDVNYPESARLANLGVPDSCIDVGEKTQAFRCIEFINGGIKIIDPDEIDDRGDINLNEIAYEIADAVVFTNYFIKYLDAFTISIPGQIAATDVNADGLTLTVADLSLLIRIIVGDAAPVPKVTPHVDAATINSYLADGMLTIGAETSHGVGAAHFVYDIEPGMSIGEPVLSAAAEDLQIMSDVYDGQLRILLYDIGTARVEAGAHELIQIPVYGDGELTLVHYELVDYYSQPYTALLGLALPEEYDLLQNYPNPFNPETTISFALPAATGWNLRVYNITGAVVWETEGHSQGGVVDVVWDGRNENGQTVASGVYLYRLDASGYSNTRKMILLK